MNITQQKPTSLVVVKSSFFFNYIQLILVIMLFSLTISSHALVGEYSENGIGIEYYKRPAQRTYAYAGKLQWDISSRVWKKIIIVYNDAPIPEKNHPVWRYVDQLTKPRRYGRYKQYIFYKPFYLTARCSGQTPLSIGRSWTVNFDRLGEGAYSKADLNKDWNCPKSYSGNTQIEVIKGEDAYSGNSLRIHYGKGNSGCTYGNDCVDWKPNIGGQFKQLYFGFRIKFPNNFDFVNGGKLPGLAGGKMSMMGSKNNNSEWGVRAMWNGDGELYQYVYYQGKTHKLGNIFKWDMNKPIEKGKWHTIQTRISLNKNDKKGGTIVTWLNGKKVLSKEGLAFGENKGNTINKVLFSTFFDGYGTSWAPKKDQYVFLDDVTLSHRAPYFKE